MLSSIDAEGERYVIESNYGKRKGYSCLGFEYAYTRAQKLFQDMTDLGIRLGDELGEIEPPKPENIGTAQGYTEYIKLMEYASDLYPRIGRKCKIELTPELIGLEGKRVEIVDKYGDKRRFIVGKSTGWMPCHLEIARRDSTGGAAVSGAPFQSIRVIESNAR